jgi:hypothetical protein
MRRFVHLKLLLVESTPNDRARPSVKCPLERKIVSREAFLKVPPGERLGERR